MDRSLPVVTAPGEAVPDGAVPGGAAAAGAVPGGAAAAGAVPGGAAAAGAVPGGAAAAGAVPGGAAAADHGAAGRAGARGGAVVARPHRDRAHRLAEVAARTGYGRLLALLAAGTHDLAGAEDALADALERALRTWPVDGIPERPDAWLLTVARNRQRDAWRSAEATRTTPLDPAVHAPSHLDDVDPDAIPDRRLELMLVCAHPAVAPGDRTPLMLNTVLGFTAEEVGRSYAVPGRTMATRLVRAKRRIRDNRIPFQVPDRSQLPARMDAVLAAVYAAYVIEWSTGPGERDLPPEALHLAEVLAELVPDDPEVRGLAALVELSAARRPARTTPDGSFVPLGEQDPKRWDAALVDRAHGHLRAAHAGRVVGRYQLEAAVQAVHCARRETGTTDWATLLDLHRSLAAVAPSLGSATALAAVTAEVEGPTAGLALLDADAGRTSRFQPAWATRAELLARLGRVTEAIAAFDRAVSLTHDTAQRRHLEHRRDALRTDPSGRVDA